MRFPTDAARLMIACPADGYHLSRGHMTGMFEPLEQLSQCPDRFFSLGFFAQRPEKV